MGTNSTDGRHCWAALLAALIIRALIISADLPCHICQLSTVRSSRCDSVRKVQLITGNC
ncbi:unnamed protein product, partial [Staurois parvus]